LGIGDDAAVAHGLAEFRSAGDPAIDGSRRRVEQLCRTAQELAIISIIENTSLK
jgi:hypothetical protein